MLSGNAIGSDAESHTQWVNAVLNAMGMLLVDAMDNTVGQCHGSHGSCHMSMLLVDALVPHHGACCGHDAGRRGDTCVVTPATFMHSFSPHHRALLCCRQLHQRV